MRKGDTWIGITIRPIAVDALKQFDAARYAPVSFADPLPPAQRPCQATGVEANQERGLAWDMNSQVGAWIRSSAHHQPATRRDQQRLRLRLLADRRLPEHVHQRDPQAGHARQRRAGL